jgi:ATP-dependent DNA helicase PIF1
MVSYATTINKLQGQSLDYVGLYLPKDVFSHGQLYVSLSRNKSKKGIKILIHDDAKTQNILQQMLCTKRFSIMFDW